MIPKSLNGIKYPNQDIEYTPEMIKDLYLCSNDIYYFFKFIKVKHPDKGRIPFTTLRPFQKELIDKVIDNKYIIALIGRQSGKSTVISQYALWYAIFNPDKTIGIVSNKEKAAINILNMIRLSYEELPNYLKPGVISYAKTSVEFENGSKIFVGATSESAFRGLTLNILICDEFAHLNNMNIQEEFWTSNFPTISESETGKVIIISTPNGMYELFHRLYLGAEQGTNGFVYVKGTWKDVPGRDEKWKEQQINKIGLNKFLQEYEVEFLGSSSTLINSITLQQLMVTNKNPVSKELDGKLLIYETPQNVEVIMDNKKVIQKTKYVIGGDAASGTRKDFSSAQVLKIVSENPLKLEQVAVYNSNTIDAYSFAEIVNRLSMYYNDAYIAIETNPSAEGLLVANIIWEKYYNYCLINENPAYRGISVRGKKVKTLACLLMKKLIENNDLKIVDAMTIKQLCAFIEKKGKFLGQGIEDDLVSALYIACYSFKLEIYDSNENNLENKYEEPLGILSDYNFNEEENNASWLTYAGIYNRN